MSKVYSSDSCKKIQATRKQSICKWLKDRTSSLDIGYKIPGKKPVHLNTNEEVLWGLNNKWRLGKAYMTNAYYQDHFENRDTYYFTGQNDCKQPLTLVLIDIDCQKAQKIGSYEGAVAYAEYLKNTRFPNMYYEPSTHFIGVHGFIVLNKETLGAEQVNNYLKMLQADLQNEFSTLNFDVELVEIKGFLPVITWHDGKATNYKSGTLAKLPRDESRFDELRNTTTVHWRELGKLPAIQTKKGLGPKVSGSISGKHISLQELMNLDDYRDIAKQLLTTHQLSTSGRQIATSDDLAYSLMIGKFFANNMNADGSLPVARWQGMWTALYEAGDIDRPFCPKRFAAIRNYLSDLNLIDWEDSSYVRPQKNSEGEIVHKGRACKWKFNAELMGLLTTREREEASLIGTLQNKHEINLSFVNSLKRCTEFDITRPVETIRIQYHLFDPDFVTQKLTCFELAA